jgi:CRP/FNR family cyclic AMP-dependent transcriptional regulator
MVENYQGKEGRAALMNALRRQFLIDGNSDLANTVAAAAQVMEFPPGKAVFTEGERGGHLFFIISGQVSVRKHGREQEIATISAGMHLGEIGVLEPFNGHSASVIAVEPTVVAQLPQQKFKEIADLHPNLWRRMALELARRLSARQAAI